MPFYRRSRVVRYRRKRTAAAPIRKQISRTVKRTLSRQIERKYFSDNCWTAPKEPDSTGEMYALNTIVAGTGVNNRIGEKLNLVRGVLNVRAIKHASATHTCLVGMVLYDKEYTNAGINSGVILDYAGGVEFQPTVRLKENIKHRFVILKRFVMNLSANQPHAIKFMSYKINKKQLFDANGANTGLIHLLLMTNEDDNKPYVYYDTRIFFTDA